MLACSRRAGHRGRDGSAVRFLAWTGLFCLLPGRPVESDASHPHGDVRRQSRPRSLAALWPDPDRLTETFVLRTTGTDIKRLSDREARSDRVRSSFGEIARRGFHVFREVAPGGDIRSPAAR